MIKVLCGVIVVGSLMLVGCGGGSSDTKDQKQLNQNVSDKNTATPISVDYESIQKKAESFVPSIGTKGGEIVLSTFSDPKSFNPITSTETSTSEYTQYIFERLVATNGVTLLPEPGLADRWDVSDSGLTWVFHIRPGVLWSDGVKFSAYDVEFTFNDLIYNDNINPNSSRDIFKIEDKKIKVKALDSTRVRFQLPFTYAPFLRLLSSAEILPKHRYFNLVKSGKFTTALSIQTPPSEIVGSGPFLLETYISSQKVVLKRNPLYWKKDSAGNSLPYLDRVVYKIVADQNAELLGFKKGDIDFLSAKGEDFPGLKKEERNGWTVYRLGPATGSSFLFFNQNTGINEKTKKPYVNKVKLSWFRNANFRKAVAYAIDRENMIRIVMNGLGYPQWSPMTPSEGYFYNPNVTKYSYDPQKSKEILAQEGFKDTNGDGYLEDKYGNTVEFSLVTNSGNIVRGKIAEMIRKDLESLGMKVHYQQLEFNTLIQKIDNPPFEWDAIVMGLTGGVEPHLGKNVWCSSGTLHMWFPRQKKPSTDWEALIDSLYTIGVKELSEEKRKIVYDQWQQIASDQLPLIYTILPERIYCIWNKFENLNPSLNGGLLHNLEYLYLKK
ncbi:MAG: ABC transporter substrate-binding protein [Fibrobacter sp.]|nr:ABC transporter substrate-binding protein [Fibrobacter sp.]